MTRARRSRRYLGAGVAVVAGALWFGACSFFHGDFPDDVNCKSNADCFTAQGEACNVSTGQCFVPGMIDAAPPRPDAKPVPDADPNTPDASDVDADVPDAEVADAEVPDA